MTYVTLNPKSGNRKVGPIPVSTSDVDSCPSECDQKGTDCYARFGPLGIHWRAIGPNGRGDNWTAFCERIKRFPLGQIWRHNQAGDLPPRKDGKIHKNRLRQLSKASRLTRGWTYTHYNPLDTHNRSAIAETNSRGGLTINLSADTPSDADKYAELNCGPVVTLLPSDAPKRGNRTPGGLPIVVCPAQTADVTCEQCQLCRHATRKSVVGFLAHGPASKRLSRKLWESVVSLVK